MKIIQNLKWLTIVILMVLNMGLLNKIFGKEKQQDKIQEAEQNTYQEEWDFYFSNVDDKLSSIALDLGLHKIAPKNSQPSVMWISIKMNNPREDGLSSNDESTILGEIEDLLVNKLHKKFDITFVGRLTSDGKRDLYFYIGENLLYDKIISETMVSFPKYQYDFGINDDPDWDGYLNFLYPSPEQYQKILNHRVLDNLESHGDPLTKERPVFHWLYFKAEKDRKKFRNEIIDLGFNIENESFDQAGEYPYLIHISRNDKVDYNSLDDYVIHLWKLAKDHNGDYDGWETSVEK